GHGLCHVTEATVELGPADHRAGGTVWRREERQVLTLGPHDYTDSDLLTGIELEPLVDVGESSPIRSGDEVGDDPGHRGTGCHQKREKEDPKGNPHRSCPTSPAALTALSRRAWRLALRSSV